MTAPDGGADRLLVFPTVPGRGERMFADGGAPAQLELVSVERSGPAVLTVYERAA